MKEKYLMSYTQKVLNVPNVMLSNLHNTDSTCLSLYITICFYFSGHGPPSSAHWCHSPRNSCYWGQQQRHGSCRHCSSCCQWQRGLRFLPQRAQGINLCPNCSAGGTNGPRGSETARQKLEGETKTIVVSMIMFTSVVLPLRPWYSQIKGQNINSFSFSSRHKT